MSHSHRVVAACILSIALPRCTGRAGFELPRRGDEPICTPATGMELCAFANVACGPLTTQDNCATIRVLSCGTCDTLAEPHLCVAGRCEPCDIDTRCGASCTDCTLQGDFCNTAGTACEAPPPSISGALDPAFGDAGVITYDFAGGPDWLGALTFDGLGNILAVGQALNTNEDLAVAKYSPDGAPVAAFGAAGYLTTDVGTDDELQAVAIDASGRIVAAGAFWSGYFGFVVVRYDANGALDTTFGGTGIVTTDMAGVGDDSIDGLVIDADGNIVVTGRVRNGASYDIGVARYDTTGTLDGSFGVGGKVLTDVDGRDDRGYGIAIDASDRLVVTGGAVVGAFSRCVVLRYDPSGALDTSFASGGIAIDDITPSDEQCRDLVIDSSGRVLVTGSASNGTDTDTLLMRYNANGTLDATFGVGGVATSDFGFGDDRANGLTLDASDRPVLAGVAYDGTRNVIAVLRYDTNGALDTSFDDDGRATYSVSPYTASAAAVQVASNGRIIVVGGARIDGATFNDTDAVVLGIQP